MIIQVVDDRIAIIPFVRQDVIARYRRMRKQGGGIDRIGLLPLRKHEIYRVPQRIHYRMYLRAQATTTSADFGVSAPLFAPADA